MFARMRWGSGMDLKCCSQLTSAGELCVVKPAITPAVCWAVSVLVRLKTRNAARARCMLLLGLVSLPNLHGLSNRIATVDPDDSPGHEVRSPRSEVHSGSGNLLRFAPSTGGGARKDFVVQGHGMHGNCHIRFNPPRRDRIYLNIVRGELNGHRFGQLHDCSFRCAVRGNKSRTKERVHAPDVDDLATLQT